MTPISRLRRKAWTRADARSPAASREAPRNGARWSPFRPSGSLRRVLGLPGRGIRFALVFLAFLQSFDAGVCRSVGLTSRAHAFEQRESVDPNAPGDESDGEPQRPPRAVADCMLPCGEGILPLEPVALGIRVDGFVPERVPEGPPPSGERHRIDRPPKAA